MKAGVNAETLLRPAFIHHACDCLHDNSVTALLSELPDCVRAGNEEMPENTETSGRLPSDVDRTSRTRRVKVDVHKEDQGDA